MEEKPSAIFPQLGGSFLHDPQDSINLVRRNCARMQREVWSHVVYSFAQDEIVG